MSEENRYISPSLQVLPLSDAAGPICLSSEALEDYTREEDPEWFK